MNQYDKTAKSQHNRLLIATQPASTGISHQGIALRAVIQGHNLFYPVALASSEPESSVPVARRRDGRNSTVAASQLILEFTLPCTLTLRLQELVTLLHF